jgi:hypothetical protein
VIENKDKEYVVLWELPDKYWCGGGCVGNREKAQRYKIDYLPPHIQSRSLYKAGNNPPLSWVYVGTCGKMSIIKEY